MIKLSELNVWVSAPQHIRYRPKVSLNKERTSLPAGQTSLAPNHSSLINLRPTTLHALICIQRHKDRYGWRRAHSAVRYNLSGLELRNNAYNESQGMSVIGAGQALMVSLIYVSSSALKYLSSIMASDVFITMESQTNLEYLLNGTHEEVSIKNRLGITPDVARGVRLLLD